VIKLTLKGQLSSFPIQNFPLSQPIGSLVIPQHLDTQNNDTQHHDTQRDNTRHNNENAALNILTLCIMVFDAYSECRYVDYCLC
jgi:hypothetical protein